MFVKNAEGKRIPDPDRGGYLPDEGREVPETLYWIRRVNEGDVVVTDPAEGKEKKGGK